MKFVPAYLEQKQTNQPPADLPKIIADLITDTSWILIYQEQVMKICREIAGYSLRETDDIRRAMGKKDEKVLKPYKASFIQGLVNNGISATYAEYYWTEVLLPFADYSFNKSHAVAYSLISYLCAYFKANYPVEFFTALMTIRSQSLMPQDWAAKAPEYIYEASQMGVKVNPPSVQVSGTGFTIANDQIYFGLNAIRDIGVGAAKIIIAARQNTQFKDIFDFVFRCGTKVNTKVLEALIVSGAFDTMGYSRKELLEKLPDIVSYLPSVQEYHLHEEQRKQRLIDNEIIEQLQNELLTLQSSAKEEVKAAKKNKSPVSETTLFYSNLKENLKIIGETIEAGGQVSDEYVELYQKYGKLRKLPALREKSLPVKPELKYFKTLTITVNELMDQANYIGCYLGRHPARVMFPDSISLANVEEYEKSQVTGQVTSFRELRTKKNNELMAVIQFSDGTAMGEIVLFPFLYKKFKDNLPQLNDIILVDGTVENIDPLVKIKPHTIKVHRRNNE